MVTHPLNLKYYNNEFKTGTCAELNAVVKTKGRKLHRCILVTIRVDRNLKLNLAKPCEGCQALMKEKNFREIWYSDQFEQMIWFSKMDKK